MVRQVGTRRRRWTLPAWAVGPGMEGWRAVLAGLTGVALAVSLGTFTYRALSPGEAVAVSGPDAGTPSPTVGGYDHPVVVHPSMEPSATPTPTGPLLPPTPPGTGFAHPGVLVSRDGLSFAKARIFAGDQPWAEAYSRMRRSDFADLDWSPKPRAVVECGFGSTPDHGCTEEWSDGVAAYTHALMWYFTGDSAHAQKAIQIIDAWSGVLRAHTGDNAPIQAAWSAAPFTRAAEIIRYTYNGWPADSMARAQAMLRDLYLPLVRDGGKAGSWGNWDLILLEAALGIAVHLDDRPLFEHVIGRWRARLPAFIYLSSDGAYPISPPGGPTGANAMINFWFGQSTFVDGVTQETCRDLNHTGWGIAAMSHIAETGWIQGVDLWAEAQPRLVAALELHSALAVGEPVPAWLCGGRLTSEFDPVPTLAYYHYTERLGLDLPRTAELIDSEAPQPARFFIGWEKVTVWGA